MTDSTATEGTTIIERRNIGHASDNTELVLVKREHGHTPYVIWTRYKGAKLPGYIFSAAQVDGWSAPTDAWTYSGHYFENFLQAVEKWAELSGQVYVGTYMRAAQ